MVAINQNSRCSRPIHGSDWVDCENSQATVHGRGQIQNIELAADASGKVTAVRVHLLADMGAYLQLVTPGIPLLGAFVYHGAYDIPVYSFTCTGVFTTKTPTDAYRGAGRPEATYAIERAMDALAARMGVDPAELRRRNFIGHDKLLIDASAFGLNISGALSAASLVSGRSPVATAPNDYVLFNTSNGSLWLDADGNGTGAAVQIATLSDVTSLSTDSFVFC